MFSEQHKPGEDYRESESTEASDRLLYIRLGLRLLCPVWRWGRWWSRGLRRANPEGSKEDDAVLLPRSSENNASQKIIKEENRRSWDEDQGALAHLQDRRKPRERRDIEEKFFSLSEMPYICFRKVFLPPMHHWIFRKHGSFCLQKQKCFIIKGLSLTQNLNSISYCKVALARYRFVTAGAKMFCCAERGKRKCVKDALIYFFFA